MLPHQPIWPSGQRGAALFAVIVSRVRPHSHPPAHSAGAQRDITLATRRARGVSRRSSKGALTPTRAVVIRDGTSTTMSRLWSGLACTT